MENKNVVKVLIVVPNMRSAGIENFVMNMYRNINRYNVQFDFLVHSEKEQIFDEEILKSGSTIFRLTYKDDKNIFKYIRDLNNFFKNHKEYKIVHGHMQSMMPLYLLIAKINKVPVRIAHAHNSDYEKTIKGFILHLFSRFSKLNANVLWACSNSAGKYLFGNSKFEVIHNAIDTDKFKFDIKKRNKVREEMNLDNRFVIGNIARFEIQKNHDFLIDIFYEIYQLRKDAVLLLVGEGFLKDKIIEKVHKLGLDSCVCFLGVRKDTDALYQGMDVFLLPSLYEGLPLVGVEAQVSGLSCFFSSSITEEIKLSNSAKFISLNSSAKEWAKEIVDLKDTERNSVIDDKYCLVTEAYRLEKKYIELLKI